MSMSSSFIYGYGFNCDCDDEKLIDFVKTHKETFCKSNEEVKLYEEMLKYTESEYDLEDFFNRYSCDHTGIEGKGAVISNIMSRETGIRFIYCTPDDTCGTLASVLFTEGYPWQLNSVERNLTVDKLESICKKYLNELGISISPDFLALEYYG